MFDSLRHDREEGIRDIRIVEDLYRNIHHEFIGLSHTPEGSLTEEEKELGHNSARALNEYVECARGLLVGEFIEESNYLFAQRAKTFAQDVGFPELAEEDPDTYSPFEITKGAYAVFSEDRSRVYVDDNPQTVRRIKETLQKGLKPTYTEVGQYFARHNKVDIPGELVDLLFDVMDEGKPLEEYAVDMASARTGELQGRMDDYVVLISGPVRNIIETDFSVKLHDLTIREQFYFLSYLKQIPVGGAEPLKQFSKIYGAFGLRTFLALDHLGQDFGKVIVDYGNWEADLNNEYQAEVIFNHFLKLQDRTNSIDQFLTERLGKKGDAKVVQDARENIRSRAARFLRDILMQPLGNTMDSYNRVLDAIHQADENLVLLTSVTRPLLERGELNFKEIQGSDVFVVEGTQLKKEDKQAVRNLQILRYGDGRSRAHEGYTLKTVQGAIAGLEGAFQQRTSRFYLFKLEGKLVACVRFDQHDDRGRHTNEPTRLYMATVMGDESIAGGRLAEANAEAAFREEQKRGLPIRATAKPELAIAEKYLEWGFVARSVDKYIDLPILHIDWDPSLSKQFTTRMKDDAATIGNAFSAAEKSIGQTPYLLELRTEWEKS